MPKCDYMDLFSTYHYIETYDNYTMGYMIEETMAVDGINTCKENKNNRTYSIGGMALSVNDSAKMYSQYDASSLAEEAAANMESAMETGTNIYGRAFAGTGAEAIPQYSDGGDTAEYEYYEFNYPDMEEYGTYMTERYYMKDGDVFAILTRTTLGDSEYDTVKVIKSISGDIPDGTFDLPDLTGYEEYEL